MAKTKRYGEAIGALRKSLEQLPDSVQSQYELGLALFETGEWRDSVPYFEFVAKKRPKWADAQFSLAAVYARTQHVPEAVDILHNVIELNPQHFRANLLLGRILTLQHHPADALPYLKQAVSAEPQNFEPHAFLAEALDQLGESQSARAERARAEALQTGLGAETELVRFMQCSGAEFSWCHKGGTNSQAADKSYDTDNSHWG